MRIHTEIEKTRNKHYVVFGKTAPWDAVFRIRVPSIVAKFLGAHLSGF